MDSLSDYVQWMGDFPFSAVDFREADALVLCSLSYIDLSPVFAGGADSQPLRACLAAAEQGGLSVMITGKDTGFLDLLKLCARSKRYGDLLLSDYVDLLRLDPPLQFSALCFHDASGLSFLSFRGTDSSLVGWKEDFLISVTRTQAQELALDYARRMLRKPRRWLMGGHSKGGNLCLYAAGNLDLELWPRLERLFILDGPGLCPEVMDLSCMDRIDQRATRILPQFSVIGRLFDARLSDTHIVQSSFSGFQQHSLISWGIDHGKLAELSENDPVSQWLNSAIDEWIDGISQEDRVVFVNELFDALAASGEDTLNEIVEQGPRAVEPILHRLMSMSDVTRKTFYDLPRQALKLSIRSLQKSAENAGLRFFPLAEPAGSLLVRPRSAEQTDKQSE